MLAVVDVILQQLIFQVKERLLSQNYDTEVRPFFGFIQVSFFQFLYTLRTVSDGIFFDLSMARVVFHVENVAIVDTSATKAPGSSDSTGSSSRRWNVPTGEKTDEEAPPKMFS